MLNGIPQIPEVIQRIPQATQHQSPRTNSARNAIEENLRPFTASKVSARTPNGVRARLN